MTAIPSSKIKTPIIKECILHYECRIIYKNDLISSELEHSIVTGFYPNGDFTVSILVKSSPVKRGVKQIESRSQEPESE